MKRRELIRMSDAEVDAFLAGRHTMNVGSVNHDGTIHLVAMWYGFVTGDGAAAFAAGGDGAAGRFAAGGDGAAAFAAGEPAFWTYGRSQKVLNLQRDPQITCLVESGDTYEELKGVELVGRAEIVDDDRDRVHAIGRSVFERYFGPWSDEMQPYIEQTGAKRVGVVVHVDKVVSWDHAKLEGGY